MNIFVKKYKLINNTNKDEKMKKMISNLVNPYTVGLSFALLSTSALAAGVSPYVPLAFGAGIAIAIGLAVVSFSNDDDSSSNDDDDDNVYC